MNLLVSFSGGETSAYMTQWILQSWRERYAQIAVVFANTGQEREETLEFVRQCDEHFGFGTVWIEAVVHAARRSPTAKVVTFETASRDGAPFEAVIAKYGIPNKKFPHCTRALKERPIHDYAKRVLGWAEYDTAIGIRADELDRVSFTAAERRLIYPLVHEHRRTKPQINSWWAAQPFRLRLKQYQGNCAWCWKKTFRKHYTIINETPEVYEFPRRMEEKYDLVGPEFSKNLAPGYRRRFFRESLSVDELFSRARKPFEPFHDEAQVFDPALDVGGACGDSCEVFTDVEGGDLDEKEGREEEMNHWLLDLIR